MDPNAIMAEIAKLESKKKKLVEKQKSAKNEKKALDKEIENIEKIKKKLDAEIENALSTVQAKLNKMPKQGTMFSILFMERSKKIIQGNDTTSAIEELSGADKKAKERYKTVDSDIKKYGKEINEIDQKIQDLRRQLTTCTQETGSADSI